MAAPIELILPKISVVMETVRSIKWRNASLTYRFAFVSCGQMERVLQIRSEPSPQNTIVTHQTLFAKKAAIHQHNDAARGAPNEKMEKVEKSQSRRIRGL